MMTASFSDDVRQRAATAADFPAIAKFIVRMNARPDQRCLHCGDSIGVVMGDLEDLGLPPERSIALAVSREEIVGLVGADLAPETGRGWLWGPYADVANPLPLCDALLMDFLTRIPKEIQVIDSFLDSRNLFSDYLARKHGYGSPRTVHLYRAERPASGYPRPPAPEVASSDQMADLAALHETAFPNTWRGVADMTDPGDDSKRVFVHTKGGKVEGYVHVEAESIEEVGHIHFLAVAPGSRGGGIGRALLKQALDWCFNERRLPSVWLTVFDNLVDARALYESAGFLLAESGVTLRWARTNQAS